MYYSASDSLEILPSVSKTNLLDYKPHFLYGFYVCYLHLRAKLSMNYQTLMRKTYLY